jgi:type I restriction enzyme S subunit
VCSSDIYVFESKDPNVLLPELLPFICQSEGFFEYAVKTSAGSLSPRTNWSHLANYEFPLPPVDEQRRIADLLRAADDCINSYLEFVDKLVSLRASFVKSVVNKTNKLCKGAKDAALGDVAEIVVGQSPPGDSYNSSGDGVPLLNGPTEFGEVYPTPVQWTTKPTKLCKPGDILFCVRGSTTGRQNISNGDYCIGRGLSAIRGKSGKTITGFLKIILEGWEGEVFQEAKGAGSTFPNITSKRLSEKKLPFIDLENQNALAEQFLSIHNSHIQANAHLRVLNNLKRVMLNKALAG